MRAGLMRTSAADSPWTWTGFCLYDDLSYTCSPEPEQQPDDEKASIDQSTNQTNTENIKLKKKKKQ